jgi:hypothetical protein
MLMLSVLAVDMERWSAGDAERRLRDRASKRGQLLITLGMFRISFLVLTGKYIDDVATSTI